MTLPYDVIHRIVSFLDYNDRVEMNKFLPLDMRIVHKINSEGHNFMVAKNLTQQATKNVEKTKHRTVKRVDAMINVMNHIYHPRNEVLFRYSAGFRKTVLSKCTEFLENGSYTRYLLKRHNGKVKMLKKLSTVLIEKINTMPEAERLTYYPEVVRII